MTDHPERTVHVRILVAIDRNGKWVCHGYAGATDKEVQEWICIDDLEDGEIFHWVEADVPLPAEAGPAIEGVVHAE